MDHDGDDTDRSIPASHRSDVPSSAAQMSMNEDNDSDGEDVPAHDVAVRTCVVCLFVVVVVVIVVSYGRTRIQINPLKRE